MHFKTLKLGREGGEDEGSLIPADADGTRYTGAAVALAPSGRVALALLFW